MTNRKLKQPSVPPGKQKSANSKKRIPVLMSDQVHVTRMGITGSGPEQLSAIIAERARLEYRASTLSPEKAKHLRTSGEAQQLEHHEAQLWGTLCEEYADYLGTPALPGMSRREATERRLRSILVDLSTAVFQEVRRELKHLYDGQ